MAQKNSAVGAGPSASNDLSESARKTQMGLAWNAYYGKLPKPLKRTRGIDDNVIINRCRPVVDVGVDFLFGQDIGFELPEDAPAGAQDWLDNALGVNKIMTFLMKLGINGAVTGQPMLKIVLDQPNPRLVVLDPSIISVKTAPDDVDKVLAYTVQYTTVDDNGDDMQCRQIIKRQENGKAVTWLILDQEQSGSGDAAWVTKNTEVWKYSWPPILDAQNLPAPNQYWGLSDIGPDLIQTNNDLNFLMSNTARIIRFHAHPKTWGRGFTADQMQVGVDGFIAVPGENSMIANLEMSSDLSSSLSFIEVLRAAMDELSRVPSIAIGNMKDVPRGQISGIALQLIFKPLIQKTEVKRRLYGDMLVELCRRLLEIGGFGAELAVTIQWPNMLPDDAMAEAQTALLWKQLGISQDTILTKLGFDADLEAQKQAEDEAEATPVTSNASMPMMTGDPTQADPEMSAVDRNIPPMNGLMAVSQPG